MSTFGTLVLVWAVVVQAACSPLGGQAPTPVALHVIVVNRTLDDVPIALRGVGAGHAWGGHYTLGRCSSTIVDGELTDEWELSVDGRRIVGAGDRIDINVAASGASSVVIEVEVGPAGVIIGGVRGGPRPSEPPFLACT